MPGSAVLVFDIELLELVAGLPEGYMFIWNDEVSSNLFEEIDKDGNGEVLLEEVSDLCGRVGPEELREPSSVGRTPVFTSCAGETRSHTLSNQSSLQRLRATGTDSRVSALGPVQFLGARWVPGVLVSHLLSCLALTTAMESSLVFRGSSCAQRRLMTCPRSPHSPVVGARIHSPV